MRSLLGFLLLFLLPLLAFCAEDYYKVQLPTLPRVMDARSPPPDVLAPRIG
jgi:hypothetical protein